MTTALASGTRIGPYTIDEQIGSGGMGIVYRATDSNLKRDVAIKALPESLATDAERLARFQREAEVLASLNHPNIAQVYGLEKTGDTTALIMELVEGTTLADRIAEGPLPADEALGIAMQIAEGLEAAHGKNIVHRDLKPANIKLRPDGTVKVLDFGIAKALAPENLVSGPQSPIMTTPATQVGMILGTAAYMSPEQAKGKPVDQRTDIWAFGCVLYEMLTGQLAFGAEDVPTTLARIIDRDMDLNSLPALISPAVRQTIQLCLQKDAKRRIADIRDVRLALEGVFQAVVPHVAAEAVATRPLWQRAVPPVIGMAVGAVLVGGILWPTRDTPLVSRFDYALPEGRSFRSTPNRRVVAISPNGRHLVYNADDGLYLRAMDELEARFVSGTEPMLAAPIFSPDGQSVAYYDAEGLKRISISGGAPVVIVGSGVTNPLGMHWGADGTILLGQPEGIYRVSEDGGTPELVISGDDGTIFYGPELLPDGDSVLFTVAQTSGAMPQIVSQALSTGERRVLIRGGSEAHYLPTGHLVYSLADEIFAIAFDPINLTVFGGPVPLVQGVARGGGTLELSTNYDVSETGTLVYVGGNIATEARTLVWVDRDGNQEPIAMPHHAYTSPKLSPDGTKVALNARDAETDIWVWDLERRTLTRLTFDSGQDRFPVWSPDGTRIAYSSQRDGMQYLSWRAADGTGSTEQLAETTGTVNQIFPASFLPDGTGILVYGNAGGQDDIGIFRFGGENRPTPLLDATYSERTPEVSPNGRWLTYVSDESGNEEVYVRPFPDINDGGRWQVSTDGGAEPVWARDGRELFYRNGRAIMVVSVQTDPTFSAGTPQALFEGQYYAGVGGRAYDISPDASRFLMIRRIDDVSTRPKIIVVQEWFEEVRRLAPQAD